MAGSVMAATQSAAYGRHPAIRVGSADLAGPAEVSTELLAQAQTPQTLLWAARVPGGTQESRAVVSALAPAL